MPLVFQADGSLTKEAIEMCHHWCFKKDSLLPKSLDHFSKDGCRQEVAELRLKHYEAVRRDRLSQINASLKQGRLEEFKNLRVTKNFDPNPRTPRTPHSPPEMRVPLDAEYLENKKIARQIFEQELHEKQKALLQESEKKRSERCDKILS